MKGKMERIMQDSKDVEAVIGEIEAMMWDKGSASVEPKTGKWKYNPYYICHECSECGEQALEKFTVNTRTLDRDYDEVLSNYCPNCGVKMIEVEDEEDEI